MTVHLGCLDGEAFSRGIAFRAGGYGAFRYRRFFLK
jgi:hypothetical protein